MHQLPTRNIIIMYCKCVPIKPKIQFKDTVIMNTFIIRWSVVPRECWLLQIRINLLECRSEVEPSISSLSMPPNILEQELAKQCSLHLPIESYWVRGSLSQDNDSIATRWRVYDEVCTFLLKSVLLKYNYMNHLWNLQKTLKNQII